MLPPRHALSLPFTETLSTPTDAMVQLAMLLHMPLSADGTLTLCEECHRDLLVKTCPSIPKHSLVCVDPGWPPEDLEPLTLLEELLLAAIRPQLFLLQLKLGGRSQTFPNSTYQTAMRGHVLAFPNPPMDTLAGMFPMPLEDVPEHFMVVFLAPAANQDDVVKMARRSKALQVRHDGPGLQLCCALEVHCHHIATSITCWNTLNQTPAVHSSHRLPGHESVSFICASLVTYRVL